MRRALRLLALAFCGASLGHAVGASAADVPDEATFLRSPVPDDRLRDTLLQRAVQRAQRVGLQVDIARVRLVVTPPASPQAVWVVTPIETMGVAGMPVESISAYGLRRVDRDAPADVVYRATLHAPLWRVVWVTQRRQARGSVLRCADLTPRAIELHRVPAASVGADCPWQDETVALRDLGAGEVVRTGDAGVRPAVAARESVRVRSGMAGILVEAQGIALASGARGDRLMVRLAHPDRLVSGVVAGPGLIQLAGDAP